MKIVGQSFVDVHERFFHALYVSAQGPSPDGLLFLLFTYLGIFVSILVAALVARYLYNIMIINLKE